jgi:predicted  nucleic acid-binding Zn-ribbon protein
MTDLEKFVSLKGSIKELSDKKIRLEERFKSEKDRLEKLLAEIQAKGYDPKRLSEIRKEKEDLLKTKLEELSSKVKETMVKLTAIEAAQ